MSSAKQRIFIFAFCSNFIKKSNKTKTKYLFFFFSIFLTFPSVAQNKFTNLELCYLSATELIHLYETQQVSPVDVLKAQIERIESYDSNINAVTSKHYEEALQKAKESERRYRNKTARPLEGVTFAIKDDLEVLGWRSTKGSLILKDAPLATRDSAIISILKDAGAVMHVQTNVPEYYCNLVTWNKLFGITKNPWNSLYTPGGSSGGNAAALAAGFATLATGSDMGGSIRFPAAMSGLYGFKPPYGRVPTSMVQYESQGPLARNFKDLNLFQNIISGPHPKMISAISPKLEYPTQYEDIKGWRIAYDPMDEWGIPIDATIKKSLEDTIQRLRSLGVTVEKIDLGFRASDFEIYAHGIFSTSVGPFCFTEPKKHPELITPYLAKLVEKYSDKSSSKQAYDAEEWIEAKHYEIQKRVFAKGFKAILMPTMCTPYIAADMGSSPKNTHVIINGKSIDAKSWIYSFTWHWNMLGHYPVINIPVGLTSENIPLGVQVIGNAYDDLTVFQIAFNWSKSFSGFYQSNQMPILKS